MKPLIFVLCLALVSTPSNSNAQLLDHLKRFFSGEKSEKAAQAKIDRCPEALPASLGKIQVVLFPGSDLEDKAGYEALPKKNRCFKITESETKIDIRVAQLIGTGQVTSSGASSAGAATSAITGSGSVGLFAALSVALYETVSPYTNDGCRKVPGNYIVTVELTRGETALDKEETCVNIVSKTVLPSDIAKAVSKIVTESLELIAERVSAKNVSINEQSVQKIE